MAMKFGFYKELIDEVDMSSSVLFPVEDKYDLAELASGFNRKTMISPFHGAVIASVIGNKGF
jgi:peptidoglycan glycosyltransferase